MIYFMNQDEIWFVIATYVAVTGSLMVSYTRSRAEALGVSCKVGLLTRVERYVVIVVSLIINQPEWGLIILAVGAYFTVIQRGVHIWRQMKDQEIHQH
jgi:CDP-diacylglycerol--glycerol-3-phosphate 3-phosphatidyltransferase